MSKQTDRKSALETLKAAADITSPGYGRWAYEQWEQLNHYCFGNELMPGGIYWGLIAPSKHYAEYDYTRNIITIQKKKWLKPESKRLEIDRYEQHINDMNKFRNYLLHEMMHQKLYQQKLYPIIDKPGKPRRFDKEVLHECDAWFDEINRLIRLLQIEKLGLAFPLKAGKLKQVRDPNQLDKNGKPKKIKKPREGYMNQIQMSEFPYNLGIKISFADNCIKVSKEDN